MDLYLQEMIHNMPLPIKCDREKAKCVSKDETFTYE